MKLSPSPPRPAAAKINERRQARTVQPDLPSICLKRRTLERSGALSAVGFTQSSAEVRTEPIVVCNRDQALQELQEGHLIENRD
jgi:hypothetical protein